MTWEWHYPIRSALWLTPVLVVCKILYYIGIYPFINVQLLLRIFTATLSAYAESKFLDFTFRMFQIFEISSNYFYLSLLSWLRFEIGPSIALLGSKVTKIITESNWGCHQIGTGVSRSTRTDGRPLEPIESIIFIHFRVLSLIQSNQRCSLWQFQLIKSRQRKECYSRPFVNFYPITTLGSGTNATEPIGPRTAILRNNFAKK